jgi:hypothetical protein
MAIVRISEPVRKLMGYSKEGWKRTWAFAMYRCDCGNEFEMQCRSEGKTKSCGCLARESARKLLTGNQHRVKHGHAKRDDHSKTYSSWSCMRGRCEDAKHIEYHRYGARGIKVCERWSMFENFLADMGDRPEGCSIDRIDPDGNYCPENCRWADAKTQARNRRNSVLLTIGGVTMTAVAWSEQPGATSDKNIYSRLDLGWSHREAVFGK